MTYLLSKHSRYCMKLSGILDYLRQNAHAWAISYFRFEEKTFWFVAYYLRYYSVLMLLWYFIFVLTGVLMLWNFRLFETKCHAWAIITYRFGHIWVSTKYDYFCIHLCNLRLFVNPNFMYVSNKVLRFWHIWVKTFRYCMKLVEF